MKKVLFAILLALGASQASARYISPEEACRRDGGWPHTHLLTGRVTCHF